MGIGSNDMITQAEEEYILTRAYVPEHIVSLMRLISKGEPFLLEDYLGLAKDNWAILVGYPLEQKFTAEKCRIILEQVRDSYRPEYLWFICPEIPPPFSGACTEREQDQYYLLELGGKDIKGNLRGKVERAARELRVERGRVFSRDHEDLVREFLKRADLSPRLRELYLAMPDYLPSSNTAFTLNARDKKGRLSAFYVVDLAARDFTTYLLGCYSQLNYVPHASDLLFYEMIKLSYECQKKTINLGLGVNEGIRRFKKKWGGVPSLPYEFCECHYDHAGVNPLREMLKRLF